MMINPNVEFFETTLENVVEDIKNWYDKEKYHYVTINGIDEGNKLTIDWIFSDYNEKNKMYVFRVKEVEFDKTIPSISNIIPSAWLAEWELRDMFDINVENTQKGIFIKDEKIIGPLRKDR